MSTRGSSAARKPSAASGGAGWTCQSIMTLILIAAIGLLRWRGTPPAPTPTTPP